MFLFFQMQYTSHFFNADSRDTIALIVCGNVYATVLGDSDAGVGCAKIDADDRCVGCRLFGCSRRGLAWCSLGG